MYKAFVYPIDNEQKVIESYFNHGYKYDHIVSLLKSEHGIEMPVRTLKRRLKSYNLSRRVDLEEDGNFNQEYIRNLIWREMQGAAGCLAGYRKMWHVLRLRHHMHVPRKLVATILKNLDPEASDRRRKKVKRRQYFSHGPNQCWHIDGMYCSSN